MPSDPMVSTGVDVLFRRQASKGKPGVASKPAALASAKPPAKPARAPKALPRHPANPFRRGLYASIFDCLATPEALKNGMSRERLTSMVSAILGRDPRLVAYGVIIFCSPLNASPTCHRHRSAAEGYGVEKLNGWVRMVLPPQGKPAARSASKSEGIP